MTVNNYFAFLLSASSKMFSDLTFPESCKSLTSPLTASSRLETTWEIAMDCIAFSS